MQKYKILNIKNHFLMFSAKHQKMILGDLGEKICANFLINQGFKILQKNYKVENLEIDLIGKFNKTIVFVEVKTLFFKKSKSNDTNLSLPEKNFDLLKFNKINRASKLFIAKHPEMFSRGLDWRMDLAAIEIYEKENDYLIKIKYYKNIKY